MEADGVSVGFFAPGPTITSLARPATSDACPCGRLPHLCTCEYYRQQRLREQQRQQHIEPQIADDVQQPGYLQLGGSATASIAEMPQPVKRRRITGKRTMRSS